MRYRDPRRTQQTEATFGQKIEPDWADVQQNAESKANKFFEKMKEVSMDIQEPKNLNEKFEHLMLEESDLSGVISKPKIIKKEYNYLIKNNSQSQQTLLQKSKESDCHPFTWWDSRKDLLKKVFLEQSSDSEDDVGNRKYVKEKDSNWLRDQEEIRKKTQKFEKERDEIIKKNRRQGLNLEVPTRPLSKQEEETYARKAKGYQQAFYQNQQLLDHKQGLNPMNLAYQNVGLSLDKKMEMAILALRQRRRFQQVRKLGLKIPETYKRIQSIRTLPRMIQEEIVKYPATVEEDSSWESDHQVLKNYKNSPLKYILGQDQRKKEQIERGSDPKRILKAREGQSDFKDQFNKMRIQAFQEASLGDDYDKQQANFVHNFLGKINNEITYFQEMVQKQPKWKKAVIDQIGGRYEILKQYPKLANLLFEKENAPPGLLEIVEEIFESDKYNSSRREFRKSRDEIQEQINFENDEFMEAQSQKSSVKSSVKESQNSSIKKSQNSSEKNSVNFSDRQSQNKNNESSSLGVPSSQKEEYFTNLYKQEAIEKSGRVEKVEESQPEIYKIIKTKFQNLELKDLKKYVKSQKKLTTKQEALINRQKDQSIHDILDHSQDSDDSIHYEGNHPWNIAMIAKDKQKVPPKSNKKQRGDQNVVNIDGKNYRWGQFKTKFLNEKKDLKYKKFVLNKGDPEKEKNLHWYEKAGFQSDDSNDENLKFERFKKYYYLKQAENHENQPFLQSRDLEDFEKIILDLLGGLQIIGKQRSEKIFQWVDPNSQIQNFGSIYEDADLLQKERDIQNSLGKSSEIFYNELEPLWEIFDQIFNEALFGTTKINSQILREIMRAFPKSQKEYRYFINMEKMEDFQLTYEEQIPKQESQIQQFEDQIPVQESFEEVEQQISKLEIKKSPKKKEKPPKKISFDFPKFNYDFEKTKIVDDSQEVKNLINHNNFIQSQENDLLNDLIPKLQNLVEKSEGALKGYHLFSSGSNKRTKFTPSAEDKAIFIGGIQVGYMLSKVPWLNTNTWGGLGIALNVVPEYNEIQKKQMETRKVIKAQRESERVFKGEKPRNFNKKDNSQESLLKLLETQLDFLKLRKLNARECPFTITSIKEDEIQSKYAVQISLKNGKRIEQKTALKNNLRLIFSIDPTKPAKPLIIKQKDHLLAISQYKESKLDKNSSKDFGPGFTFEIQNTNKFIVTLKLELKIQF